MRQDQDLFETLMGGDERPPGRQSQTRPGCFIFGIALLVLLFLFGRPALNFYTDWLWFTHDVGQPAVFTKIFTTTVTLWIVGFVVAFIALFITARLALRAAPIYASIPEGPAERAISTVQTLIERHGTKLAAALAGVLSLLFGTSLAAQHERFLWANAAVTFGRNDPAFGRDVGFYVFHLPWYQAIAGYALGLAFFATAIAVAAFLGLRALAQMTGSRINERQTLGLMSVTGGLFVILLGVGQWLGRFEVLSRQGNQFAGPGHAGMIGLNIGQILAVATIALGVLIILNARLWKPFAVARIGFPALLVAGIVGVGIVPSITQRLVVEPNRLSVEAPYAKRAIEMTRWAFNIDRFRVKDFQVRPEPTQTELQSAQSTLDNMRLWDPQVLRRSVDGLQSLRPYYTFSDVDIDRYTINGEDQMVMLAARDIDTNGLSDNARTWVNTRLQYTHGFGLVMTPVNRATAIGQPQFMIRDFPPRTPAGLEVKQPRIYFSDFDKFGEDGYAIVRTRVEEFDYPSQAGSENYRWTGTRGIPVGSLLPKLAFSAKFGDGNLLVSPNLRSDSRLLYRRNIRERAALVYPMTRFDRDPYLVLYQGRLIWILDAYLTSSRVPYSDGVQTDEGMINYARNAFKVVVDAYSGEMTAYAIDDQEPMTRAYRRIFPNLIRPAADAPAPLREHFRYGEDLFLMQAAALTQYHVTDPQAFLNNEDAWQLPTERGRTGAGELMLPYYVQMRLPGTNRDSFMLILPFTPRQKNNMIGWMAAHCDPEQFGEVELFRFPKDTQTPGPNQMEGIFNQDREVAEVNRQLNNDQSEIIPGNLLVIPLGSSILYVKPLFLQSRTANIQAIPELKKVILALPGSDPVIGDTYQEALSKLFGRESAVAAEPSPAEPTAPGTTPPPTSPIPRTAVTEALELFDQAEQALRRGDFARYGELQNQAKQRLREALRR